MDIIQALVKEMEAEAAITRKMLPLIPTDKLSWKPHEKSMSLQSLAVHLAEIPAWVSMALNTSELDFGAMDFTPTQVNDSGEIVSIFENSVSSGLNALRNAKEDDLYPSWTMRTGDQIHAVMNKYEVIRHAFAQTIHHRAQLGVYLRLLNIPIPGSYGPSADDMKF
ncbi:MAG: DinB family protein [Chitinophagaceae bacterium]|nr:MAG: DinB family protein [Chitinophagaceae bacterium]